MGSIRRTPALSWMLLGCRGRLNFRSLLRIWRGVVAIRWSSRLEPDSRDTPHFDVVVAEASKGIAAVARESGVPVIFGVLTTDTMQQALERAGIKSNLGWSYGLQALEMGSLMAASGRGVGVTLPDFLGVGTQKGGTTYCMNC